MKVIVRWMYKNPFSPDGIPVQRSEAELPAVTTFKEIEMHAKEATPAGYFLKSIDIEGESYEYYIDGSRKPIK